MWKTNINLNFVEIKILYLLKMQPKHMEQNGIVEKLVHLENYLVLVFIQEKI